MSNSGHPTAAARTLAAVPFLAPLDPVDLAKLAGVLEDSGSTLVPSWSKSADGAMRCIFKYYTVYRLIEAEDNERGRARDHVQKAKPSRLRHGRARRCADGCQPVPL